LITIAKGKGWINFSGTTGQVERAFHTQIDEYLVDGKVEHANSTEPSIPVELYDLIAGLVSLHSFQTRPAGHQIQAQSSTMNPNYTFGFGSYALAPADFATIYDVQSLYGTYTGSGVGIAIPARSDIHLTDVQSFRTTYGLPSHNPTFIVNGTDPGIVCSTVCDQAESTLDVEWAGAIAPAADITLVTSASTGSTDGIVLSSEYAVEQLTAPIISLSYGQCESALGSGGNAFWNTIWNEAAASGITVLVASGDSGVAGCAAAGSTSSSGAAVSGLASTPYNVAVGGTEFNDSSSYSTYWSASNSASGGSALIYIPEVAWNDGTGLTPAQVLATGGGQSTVYSKPTWQSATNVPADGVRDVPDVAFNAGVYHDPYLVVLNSSSVLYGGTSVATPSFAGIVALLEQEVTVPLGNIAPTLYSLGTVQYGSSGPAVFNDITSGNNSVPGTSGFSAGTAYDLTTGLGSVDAANLLSNYPVPTIYRPDGVTTLVLPRSGGTASCSYGPPSSGSLSSTNIGIRTAGVECQWSYTSTHTTTHHATLWYNASFTSDTVGDGSIANIEIDAGATALSDNSGPDAGRFSVDIPIGTNLSTIIIDVTARAGLTSGDFATVNISNIYIEEQP